ncbi:cobalt-precorrin 5A hydrolase [Ruminococcus sp.]
MKIAYFWMTQKGHDLTCRLQKAMGGIIEPKAEFPKTVQRDFQDCDALVFVMAMGIVVRTIAPLIRSKDKDPAVIVLDQNGTFAISLLSGHLGGANYLTKRIAAAIQAQPVITTATDVQGVLSFDEVAKQNDLCIENLEELKYISGALLDGKTIDLYSELPLQTPYFCALINVTETPTAPYRVVISSNTYPPEEDVHTLFLRPKNLVIGIGCKRDTIPEHLEICFQEFLQTHHLSRLSVTTMATIQRKKREPAILALCEKYGFQLEIVPDDAIRNCGHIFEESAFVQQITGLPAVAEACSYLASDCGDALTGKVRYPGVTFAACKKSLPALVLKEDEEDV